MEFFRIRRDIPFMRYALVFNVISVVTFLLAVLFLATRGLNFGVDFRGGTVIEVGYGHAVDFGRLRGAIDKLALGDKLQASADYRGALFAFQDAVYLDPRHAVARVKLGRAYWILRYVGQADEQWDQATQLAPNDPSIARMIEEARKAPRRRTSPPAPILSPACFRARSR